MKLLIVTQVVDDTSPSLGFFCNWLSEFSRRFSSIEVICLSEGPHTLPKNVRVHSLGKEHGGNRVLYVFRFIRLAWRLRKDYDAVFVHMNPEYILLAGDQWRLFNKKVYLWYNHTVGSVALRLAAPFTKRIFHTSPFAYSARFKNAKLMPAGVDTTLFSPQSIPRNRNAIYFQGRVAPAKRVHVLLSALRTVREKNPDATVTIVGPEDAVYGKSLREEFADLLSLGAVTFEGPKKNEETPALYASHGVSVNLTAAGNFDKTVLEALSCETPALVSGRAFASVLAEEWIFSENDSASLAQAILRVMALTPEEYAVLGKKGREAVVANHSLSALANQLQQEISL